MENQTVLEKEYPTMFGKGFFELREFLDENGGKCINVHMGLLTTLGYTYDYASTKVTVKSYEPLDFFNDRLGKITLIVESDNPSKANETYEILDDKLNGVINDKN